MMLKKFIILFFIQALMLTVFSVSVSADEYDYGVTELYNSVPEDTKKIFEENNINADGSGIEEVTVEKIIKLIIEEIQNSINQPMIMFVSLTAVIIISSLTANLADEVNSSVRKGYCFIASLISTIIISSYLSTSLEGIDAAVSAVSDFSLTYIPVMAGVMAVGGYSSTAAIYSSLMMIAVQVLSQITVNILLPLTSCLIGITAAGGLDNTLGIEKIGNGLKKAVIWGLGFIMTIFIGFLTLQSNISASADSVSLRAARFAVSTSVPFVGSAVSDALSTVKTSLELLKSGIGSFGILTGGCILLPVFIKTLCLRFVLFSAGIISDIFGTDDAGRMIKCGESIISIVISMLICFFLFITVSTTLMLLICRH